MPRSSVILVFIIRLPFSLQFQYKCAIGKTAAETGADDGLTLAQQSVSAHLIKADRHACRGGVAEAVHVDVNLFLGQMITPCDNVQNAQVGLMRNDPVDVISGDSGALKRGIDRLRYCARGEAHKSYALRTGLRPAALPCADIPHPSRLPR